MPSKIAFRLTHFSSEDEGSNAMELNTHSPTSKGWSSARFCSYPQVLLIKLAQTSCIKKIQVLSHQFLIATKIAIFVANGDQNSQDQFTRLGFVELSENISTNFKARELKSIHVNVIGEYLKLVLYENYKNELNQFNQVGLMAINVLGDFLNFYKFEAANSNVKNGADIYSPLDDLAFEMYQDPAVAELIRKFDALKKQSVLEEKFDDVIELQEIMHKLQKYGEKLGKLEVEKQQAIDSENYEKAKTKKLQIETIRNTINQEIILNKYFKQTEFPDVQNNLKSNSSEINKKEVSKSKKMIVGSAIITSPLPPINSNNNSTNRNFQIVDHQETIYQPTTKINTGLVKPMEEIDEGTNDPAPKITNAYDAYEERLLPAIKNAALNSIKNHNETNEENIAEPKDEYYESENIDILNERERNEAVFIQEVFGNNIVDKLFSKHWNERQEALEEIYEEMRSLQPEDYEGKSKRMLNALTHVFSKTLKDIVASIVSKSLEIYEMVLIEFVPTHKISRHEVVLFVEKTMPLIFKRTNDSLTRCRDQSKKFLMDMSLKPEMQQLNCMSIECIKPLRHACAPRLGLTHIELFSHMYQNLGGLEHCNITLPDAMKFLMSALNHNSGAVREEAERMVVVIYKDVGSVVRDYFISDNEKTRKNLLHRQLLVEFDKIDATNPNYVPKIQIVHTANKKLQPATARISKTPQPLSNRKNSLKQNEIITRNNHNKMPETRNSKNISADPPKKIITNFEAENQCIFCGEINETFDREGLDSHYIYSCPVLITCSKCMQVVEMVNLSDHYLSECAFKKEFQRCSTCKEAIHNKEYSNHIKKKLCTPSVKNAAKCSLCHINVEKNEEAWINHLLYNCNQNKDRLSRTHHNYNQNNK